MNNSFNINFLEKATETLRAVAHPIRILIIEMLHNGTPLSVKEIHTQIGIEQAVASHHLRIMKNKDIVSVTRDGKNSLYSLKHSEYYYIIEHLKPLIK